MAKPKETTIRLDRKDIELLERGGSISYELKSAAKVVWLSMKREGPPRFNPPSNAKNSDSR